MEEYIMGEINKDEKEIRYFSMFTGVGGFELGFQRTNDLRWIQQKDSSREGDSENFKNKRRNGDGGKFTCVGCSEINKYASELLKQKFPNVKNYGDATKINSEELPDFDMLCGGFPCQAFSIAGKRRGFEDTRGTLFFEIARILKIKRPKIILLENVKGLLNHEKGETFRIILQTLDELGYEVQWMVLNSKFFGVPQNRERVFIIGSLRGEPKPKILSFREDAQIPVERQGKVSPTITKRYYKQGQSDPYIVNEKEIRIRKLTPTECERLQGFPDGWTKGFSDTQRYKMMGNAVTVNVVQAIATQLLRQIDPKPSTLKRTE